MFWVFRLRSTVVNKPFVGGRRHVQEQGSRAGKRWKLALAGYADEDPVSSGGLLPKPTFHVPKFSL